MIVKRKNCFFKLVNLGKVPSSSWRKYNLIRSQIFIVFIFRCLAYIPYVIYACFYSGIGVSWINICLIEIAFYQHLKLQSRVSEVVLNPDEINLIFEKCFLVPLRSVLSSFQMDFLEQRDSRQMRHTYPEFSLIFPEDPIFCWMGWSSH